MTILFLWSLESHRYRLMMNIVRSSKMFFFFFFHSILCLNWYWGMKERKKKKKGIRWTEIWEINSWDPLYLDHFSFRRPFMHSESCRFSSSSCLSSGEHDKAFKNLQYTRFSALIVICQVVLQILIESYQVTYILQHHSWCCF